jgi:hypothetical protein
MDAAIYLPAEIHYITEEQLRSTMWRLAYYSRELRVLMALPDETAAHHAEVLNHLRGMEQMMIDLNRTGWPTNHPMIDANRSSFLQDIRTAQDGVSRDPPNFFWPGQYREPLPIVTEAGEQRRYHRRVVGPKSLYCGTSKYDS